MPVVAKKRTQEVTTDYNKTAPFIATEYKAPGRVDAMGFDVVGVIEDQPVFAQYDGCDVRCAAALWDRAVLLVSLGESFQCQGVSRSIDASLHKPGLAMFLTLIRACDEVVSARFSVPVRQKAD